MPLLPLSTATMPVNSVLCHLNSCSLLSSCPSACTCDTANPSLHITSVLYLFKTQRFPMALGKLEIQMTNTTSSPSLLSPWFIAAKDLIT